MSTYTEQLLQILRELNPIASLLVDVTQIVSLVAVVVLTVALVRISYQVFLLYFWSQRCEPTDLVARYGKWAVISGATDGIGRALAFELARRGHSIVVIGRNELKLADTKADLEQVANVGEVVTIRIDLSDSSLQNFDRIKGRLDADKRDIGILINNAGMSRLPSIRFDQVGIEVIRKTVNINILATMYLTRMILPGMVCRGRGLVVNVSSIIGDSASPLFNAYGPSKTFINQLSRNLQFEFSDTQIDIVNLTTGPVKTKMLGGYSRMPDNIGFTADPDYYAKSVVNALSTRIGFFSGTFMHGLIKLGATCSEIIGIGNRLRMLEFGMFTDPEALQKKADYWAKIA